MAESKSIDEKNADSRLLDAVTNTIADQCDMLDITARGIAEGIITLVHAWPTDRSPIDSSSNHSPRAAKHGNDL